MCYIYILLYLELLRWIRYSNSLRIYYQMILPHNVLGSQITHLLCGCRKQWFITSIFNPFSFWDGWSPQNEEHEAKVIWASYEHDCSNQFPSCWSEVSAQISNETYCAALHHIFLTTNFRRIILEQSKASEFYANTTNVMQYATECSAV